MKVSAGIGASIVYDGKVLHGHTATEGEIGHDHVPRGLLETLNAEDLHGLPALQHDSPFFRCSCGRATDHLGAYASETAVICWVLRRPVAILQYMSGSLRQDGFPRAHARENRRP